MFSEEYSIHFYSDVITVESLLAYISTSSDDVEGAKYSVLFFAK